MLAGGIAHDFNNFLTVIQGHVELAQMQIEPASPVHQVLGRTVDACRRAALLSSQLLTFARGGSPVRRVVPVSKLILDTIKLARAGAAASISVGIAEDLWPAEVDANQIAQVLHSILLNAKQSMPGGGIIEVRGENVVLPSGNTPSGGAYVRISVTDYGTGIPADIIPRIFDPYFTTKQSASGLGLATAYAIVSKHGGKVAVESKYGRGTTFIVDLPAAQSSPASAPAPTPRAGARLQRTIGRLLVMDDEEALRMLLVQVLVRFGHEVQSARDGAEAIDLYQAAQSSGRRFDLLDLTVVSGMGGEETARSLKELDPSAKLIASSGYSDAPVMSSFRDYGFDDVLPKPWVAAELDAIIRRVLGDDKARASSTDRTSSPAPPQEGPR
ncbi:MAG: ATP-binding protein [Acidobacteriota bacterium]